MRALVGLYLLATVVAWPVIMLSLAAKLNGLRHGPHFKSVASVAAGLALVWPLALVVVFAIPRIGSSR